MLERAMQLFEMKRRMQEENCQDSKIQNISSERILPIDAQTIEMLKSGKEQARELLQFGINTNTKINLSLPM